MADDNIIDAGKDLQIQKLKNENDKLQNEINKLKVLLKELDPDADVSEISDQEIICIEQIKKLREYSKQRELTNDEIRNLDLLVKNIRLIRGESGRTRSGGNTKNLSEKELEAIIKGS